MRTRTTSWESRAAADDGSAGQGGIHDRLRPGPRRDRPRGRGAHGSRAAALPGSCPDPGGRRSRRFSAAGPFTPSPWTTGSPLSATLSSRRRVWAASTWRPSDGWASPRARSSGGCTGVRRSRSMDGGSRPAMLWVRRALAGRSSTRGTPGRTAARWRWRWAPTSSSTRPPSGADEDKRARETRHSTAAEAARIAARARARRLVLTHISARYSDAPGVLRRQARALFPATDIAHDGLELEIGYRE